MNYENIGKFISKKRKEKNMTQKELALSLGITAKAVSRWERGLGCPDVSLLEKLSKSLDISILEILKGSEVEDRISIKEAENYLIEASLEEKKKAQKVSLYLCSFCILFLSLFVLYLNISNMKYLNKKESHDYHDSNEYVSLKLEQIEKRIELIDKTNYKIDDKETFKKNIKEGITQLKNTEVMKKNGKEDIKIKDMVKFYFPNIATQIVSSYKLLISYSEKEEDKFETFQVNFLASSYPTGYLSIKIDELYQYQNFAPKDEMLLPFYMYSYEAFVKQAVDNLDKVSKEILEVGGIYE